MRRGTLFWGLIFILAGILLLLDNLGIIAISVWGVIWSVLLIALGFWILWGVVFKSSQTGEEIAIPLEGARRGRIRVNHGGGRLSLDAAVDSEDLVAGTFVGGLDPRVRRSGDTLDVDLSVEPQTFFWAGPFSGGYNWTFGLNPTIPLSIDMNTGAGEAQVDLSGLQVEDFRLKTGASSTRLTLPAHAGFTQASIESGAASTDVFVPEGVAARIRVESGLASINIDRNRFPKEAGVFQSPDFASAENKVDLIIKTGVGAVSVR